MAKKDDKAKIRLFYVEMEGSNDALESSIRDVVKAISQPAQRPRPAVPRPAPKQQLPSGHVEPEFDFDTEETEYEDAEVIEDKPKPKKKSVPKFTVLELNLESGSPTLKEFYDSKSPTNNQHRYLVAMFWLNENLGIESVGVDHMYTCFRFLDLPIPTRVRQVFLDMVKPNKGYITRTGRGQYRINHIGENIVNGLSADSDDS